MTKPRRWTRLDNAAKIYPAAQRRGWAALFRLSATLTEPVDPVILEEAQRRTAQRFGVFSYKLKRGMFWYYLEDSDDMPKVEPDVGNPCICMRPRDNDGFSFRVRYYENRIAVEIFHVLTDGTGGLLFLKTLVAEYLRLKYRVRIPATDGVFDCDEAPKPEEIADGFMENAGSFTKSRSEEDAFRIPGAVEKDHFVHIVTGSIPAKVLLEKAHEKNVTLTEYLTAVLIESIVAIQSRTVIRRKRQKPVKITVPVNLRGFFPSKTLRNFANYVNPGIDPRCGSYTFDEILSDVHHFMGLEVTKKALSAKITTNVRSEQNKILRMAPLFLKNPVMRIVFNAVGDRKSSTCFSNLGNTKLPEEMAKYVTRMEFILGPLSRNRVAVAALSYDGTLRMNFTRTLVEPVVEQEFFTRLVKLGIPVKVESNQRW